MACGIPDLKGDRDIQLEGQRLGFALSWEAVEGEEVDLDLQGIAFDGGGKLLDAVYYNNKKALDKALVHAGDDEVAEDATFQEVIWVHTRKLPTEVELIIFVIACPRGGQISQARSGKFHILQDSSDHEVGAFPLEDLNGQAAVLGGMNLQGAEWKYSHTESVATEGMHFIDILEPLIGDFVRSVMPQSPKVIKANFAMEKGSVVDLPASGLKSCQAGLGWDTAKGEVDLDVSAVMIGQDGKYIDAVYYNEPIKKGIQHSGDSLTGAGGGDDETINVNFSGVSVEVQQIIFVINCYTAGKNFSMVADPYCRLIMGNGDEYCRYQLAEAGKQQGLIMARLFRVPGTGRWGFQALGIPCRGRCIKEPECMDAIVVQAKKSPLEMSATAGMPMAGDDEMLVIAPHKNEIEQQSDGRPACCTTM